MNVLLVSLISENFSKSFNKSFYPNFLNSDSSDAFSNKKYVAETAIDIAANDLLKGVHWIYSSYDFIFCYEFLILTLNYVFILSSDLTNLFFIVYDYYSNLNSAYSLFSKYFVRYKYKIFKLQFLLYRRLVQ